MKRKLIFLATLCVTILHLQGQNTYLWPIANAKPGTNMISTPQSYIGNELNFGELFIAAPEGTVVVSPVDGIISHLSMRYSTSLSSCFSFSVKSTFDATIAELRKSLDKEYDPQYVSGNICIQCPDGNKIYIHGLSGDQQFKTGQKITRNTPIGRVAYTYRPIRVPSICISIDKGSRPTDPMSPFGIKSTFIPPAEAKPIATLSKQKVMDDFEIYIDVLKECYPALYDVISPEEFDQYIARTKAGINAYTGNIPYVKVVDLFVEAVAKIHDSHIYLHTPQWFNNQIKMINQPKVALGWFNDTLICRNVASSHRELLGRPVKSVNGKSADSLKQMLTNTACTYDGNVQSLIATTLAYANASMFRATNEMKFDYNMRLEMADNGETINIPASEPGAKNSFLYTMLKFGSINRHKEGYKLQMLNDSTAYIGLSHFQLSQVQLENIGQFIDSIAKVPHLIIDVRNNSGGDVEALSKLYSHIAGEPMTLDSYSRVNKQGGYHSFSYSLNRLVEDSLFADYKPEEGKKGYFLRPKNGEQIRADSAINYKGKVYVLANEGSVSAATMFPALLVRNHRGVVVGRETRTTYHYMNALKFATIRLPNSTLTINMPLVYCCFDTAVSPRVPYGRGVLPDYEVPLSVDELSYKNGDAILNEALRLIREGKYLLFQ